MFLAEIITNIHPQTSEGNIYDGDMTSTRTITSFSSNPIKGATDPVEATEPMLHCSRITHTQKDWHL